MSEYAGRPDYQVSQNTPGVHADMLTIASMQYNDGSLYGTEVQELPGDIEAGKIKTFDFKFHGAESYSDCAVYVGYYKKHTDTGYTQLGDYVFFTTGDTPVHDIDATPVGQEPAYRLDGVRLEDLKHKGIIIRSGKIQLQK